MMRGMVMKRKPGQCRSGVQRGTMPPTGNLQGRPLKNMNEERIPALGRLAEHPRREALLLGAVLVLSSAVALAVLAFRIYYGGRRGYAFQSWNLFLAWIPMWLALAIAWVQGRQVDANAWRLKPAALA